MRWKTLFLTVAVAAFATAECRAQNKASDDAIRNATVRVVANATFPDMSQPWVMRGTREVGGSGVIIEGNRVLTSAAIVLYARTIDIQANGTSQKYKATVELVAPAADLALLKVDDPKFFEGKTPVKIAKDLPELKESVTLFGYSMSNVQVADTKGTIQHVDFTVYPYDGLGLLVRVEADLRAGNIGGPVFSKGEMIGIVFSRFQETERTGFIIPTEEINSFLAQAKSGKYEGKARLLDDMQALENASLRDMLGIPGGQTGVIVRKPSSLEGNPLKEWDVVVQIGDYKIDNTGLIQIKKDLNVGFQYAVSKIARNGRIPITLIRDRKLITYDAPTSARSQQLVDFLMGRQPSYFVFGPLVFTPASAEFLLLLERSSRDRRSILSPARKSPFILRNTDAAAFGGEELVVVSNLLPHDIAKGYRDPFGQVVESINGVKIRNLAHMVETIRDLKQSDEYISIRFAERGSETIVFQRKFAAKATAEVLKSASILEQCSEDLKQNWNEGKSK